MSGERIPDAIMPVVGYRVFTVMMGKLWSPLGPYRVAWPTSGPLRARCLRYSKPLILNPLSCPLEGHEAPDPGCACGIHAMWEPWDIPAVSVPQPWDLVVGRVHGWGRVVVAERGWRAELAQPIELFASLAWNGPTRLEMARAAAAYRLPLADAGSGERDDAAA